MDKVAVIGSGYWGKNLVRNFAELGALGSVCDRNTEVLNGFREQYPQASACTQLNEVLKLKEIKGVAIATPAETHFRLAREAILAGKHVFVEKPLTLEPGEAKELINLAAGHDRVLMVGHLLHYHPAFIALKEMAANGQLGRINYIYSNRLNLGKIRREENILWSFAPHDISMILSLAGEKVEKVHATGGFYLHKKIADVTCTHMEFPSGLKAHIFVSWLHPFKEQKLVVVGDEKMAVFDDTQPWEAKLLLYPHRIVWENRVPVPDKAEAMAVAVAADEPLKAECREFLDCMAANRRPVTDGREGLHVLEVLKAAQNTLDADNGAGCSALPTSNIMAGTGDRDGSQLQRPDRRMGACTTGCKPEYFVHDTAVVDTPAEIGAGTKIWHFSHILRDTRIGENCNIGQNVVIGPGVSVGRRCKIQNNVSVYKGVTLEDDVFCGPSMVFTNIFNPRAEINKMDQVRPTRVKKGATLGANCTVVCGVTIGRYAFVGAGAVVTRDVPDHALVVGNPARQIGWMCACGGRADSLGRCRDCGKKVLPGKIEAELDG